MNSSKKIVAVTGVLFKDNFIFSLLIILMIFSHRSLNAQSLNELENRFENTQTQLLKEQGLTDSLNKVLSQKVKQIDNEKNKRQPDKEIVVQLMSSSASISNSIDSHQKKINELKERSNQLARQLSVLYDAKIDSLRRLQSSSGNNSKELEAEILLYTEKRLLIEPGIQNLSFNPAKILTFDTNKLKDKKEKAAYSEYLQNALKEVNSILSGVTEKNSEVEEILLLQKKTQKFLKEIEFEGRPGTRKYSSVSSETNGNGAPRGGRDSFDEEGLVGVADAVNSQVYAYNSLLTQLAFDKSISANLKWDINLEKGRNYDLNDYKDLLTELKRNLQEYKEVLRNKLDSVK